ncbi:hypothetical protein AB5J49_08220 [Streptomyces sp. R28]|uniref:Uncharacterized protein n=1 Tax=Streptomyces sp. R28 TaxID=3238628 RepID=A0AB39PU11_9ACTN
MSGRELDQHVLGSTSLTSRQRRAAAVHVADRIAAEHPQLTSAELAANPIVTARLRELLNVLDLNRKEQQ